MFDIKESKVIDLNRENQIDENTGLFDIKGSRVVCFKEDNKSEEEIEVQENDNQKIEKEYEKVKNEQESEQESEEEEYEKVKNEQESEQESEEEESEEESEEDKSQESIPERDINEYRLLFNSIGKEGLISPTRSITYFIKKPLTIKQLKYIYKINNIELSQNINFEDFQKLSRSCEELSQ